MNVAVLDPKPMNNLTRQFCRVLLACVLANFFQIVRAEPAADSSIRQFLAISGQEDGLRASIMSIMPMVRQMGRNIPEHKLMELFEPEAIIQSLVTVYRRSFTEEEIQELLALYGTPVGKKYGQMALSLHKAAADWHVRKWQASLIDEEIQKGNFKMLPSEAVKRP